jgi:hypothetical protein
MEANAVAVSPGITIFSVILLALIALGVVGAIFLYSRAARCKTPLTLGHVLSFAVTLLLCLPAAAFLLYLLRASGPHFAPEQSAQLANDEAAPIWRPESAATPLRQVANDSTDEPEAAAATESTRQESPLPDWARNPQSVQQNATLLVLNSKQYATPEQAEQEVLQLAAQRFTNYFEQTHPYQGAWTLPAEFLKARAVRHSFVQTIDHDFGRFTGRMYRAYVQLKLSPEVREQAHGIWREQIVEQRLLLLGRLIGFVTLLLALVAGYFRLDALTKGAYRGRLKLAASAVAVAGGMLASWHLERSVPFRAPVGFPVSASRAMVSQ